MQSETTSIGQAVGPYDNILTTVKKRKLKWFGHVSRSAGLAKTILQGTVHGGRRRGRQKVEVLQHRKKICQQNQMEGKGCYVRGAPTVTMTTG